MPNRAPTGIRLANRNVAEAEPGAVIGRLKVRDPDAGDTFTYVVDDARFVVTPRGQLKLAPGVSLDHEAADQVVVTVTATDQGGLSVQRAFTLDVLDRPPEIDLAPLDGPLLGDRLVFSVLGATDGRVDNRAASLLVRNTGTDTLNVADLIVTGPFALVDPAQDAPTTVAPGGVLSVAVRFDPSQYDPTVDPELFGGTLTVISDDADEPSLTIDLSGFWQREPERGQEPTVNEIWQVFGYGNSVPIAGLNNFDIVETLGPQEVLSAYWRLADGAEAATVTWLASFHGFNTAAGIAIHAPGDAAARVQLLTQVANSNQTVLPTTTIGSPTTTVDAARVPDAWAGDDVFGFYIQGGSSDPTLNLPGPGTPPDPDAPRGHFLRFFQALDGAGVAIPDTWLVIEDYNSRGINYDYNDNMFVISGIVPAGDFV